MNLEIRSAGLSSISKVGGACVAELRLAVVGKLFFLAKKPALRYGVPLPMEDKGVRASAVSYLG